MTYQEIKALALALHSTCPSMACSVRTRGQWMLDVEVIANVCKAHTEGFNRPRFYVACGYSEVADSL